MRWSNLNNRGKLNYIFFVCNTIFMCISVMSEHFKMAILHCGIAFLCWLSTHTTTCYKQEDE